MCLQIARLGADVERTERQRVAAEESSTAATAELQRAEERWRAAEEAADRAKREAEELGAQMAAEGAELRGQLERARKEAASLRTLVTQVRQMPRAVRGSVGFV